MDLSTIIKQPKTTLVDVRQPFELLMGKAKGAINIPLGSIPKRIEEFKSMEGPIVVFCASGNRSGQAAAFLKQQGVNKVYNGGSVGEIRRML